MDLLRHGHPAPPAQLTCSDGQLACSVTAPIPVNGHLAIVNVALPTIGRKLHTPESSLQWVVTGYALTFGGFLLLGGRAGDLLGRRRILMAGLFVFIAASLGLSLLVYTTSTAPQVGWGAARTVTLLAVWAALLAALVVIETRVEAPLMPLRIFQNKTLAPPLLGQPETLGGGLINKALRYALAEQNLRLRLAHCFQPLF